MVCCSAVALLAFGTAMGCSRSGMESSVSGTVSLEGKPIGPGTVSFVPSDKTQNPAVGTIQPNGSYYLKSNRVEGLPAGNYQAAVTVYEPINLPPGERSSTPSKPVHPDRYMSPETSGLAFEVKPGSNTINIDLTSK
jgi:hypothetical protein